MKIHINQKFDENYFKEYYSQFFRYKSNLKLRFFIFAVFATIMFYMFSHNAIIAIYFVCGYVALEILTIFFTRRSWLKSRINSKFFNMDTSMSFEDDMVFTDSPLSKNEMKWEHLNNVVFAKKGLFIGLESGLSLYISKSAFADEKDIESITKKIREANG